MSKQNAYVQGKSQKLAAAKTTLFTAAVLLGTAAISPVGAATATFTSDHCTGGCGPQTNGFATIDATQAGANTINVTITLLNNNGIVDTGLHAFTFNLVGDPTITFSNFSSPLFDVVGSTTNTVGAGVIHQDGFGDFEYALDYTGGPGGSNPYFGSLSFTISGANLTLASFAELSKGGDPSAFFSLDIISGTTGRTGAVDCCTGRSTPFEVSTVPLPAALPLFAGGLGVMGVIGWRKRRKVAAAAA